MKANLQARATTNSSLAFFLDSLSFEDRSPTVRNKLAIGVAAAASSWHLLPASAAESGLLKGIKI